MAAKRWPADPELDAWSLLQSTASSHHCVMPACIQVRETKKKGDTIGELAFLFRLRHIHAACAGKTRVAVFALAYSDYKQVAATYVDDETAMVDALVDSVDSSKSDKFSMTSETTLDSTTQQNEGAVWRKVDEAVRRRKEQNVVKLLAAVAAKDMRLVQLLLESEHVEVCCHRQCVSAFLHVCGVASHCLSPG